MPHETLENEQSSSFTEEKRKSHPDGKGKVHELAQWVQTNQKLTEHLVCAKCCGLYQIKMSSPKKKKSYHFFQTPSATLSFGMTL